MADETQNISFMLDPSEKCGDLPEYDPDRPCPDHPHAGVSDGFGLAGGGSGVYTICNECCRIVSKSLIQED